MFTRTKLTLGLLAAFGSLSAVSGAWAQSNSLDRVEITGSAIRRIPAEGALPVLQLKKEDIERTGATSTVDLLQRLSTVQGGTMEANAVGGSTFGFSGVSVHNIGETRTLVLLNGHRLSQFGGQTLTGFAAGVDLNSIPIASIERVEVLTDGAASNLKCDIARPVRCRPNGNPLLARDRGRPDVHPGPASSQAQRPGDCPAA